ncbi:hypothetical protein FACS1894188_01680 [Clostridia bacterium]|nr:hypothetical protein FACS1894188_01680 [Clostridia bacterium]
MPIELGNKVSEEDKKTVLEKRQPPPKYEEGFGTHDDAEDDEDADDDFAVPSKGGGFGGGSVSPRTGVNPAAAMPQTPMTQPSKTDEVIGKVIGDVTEKGYELIVLALGSAFRVIKETRKFAEFCDKKNCFDLSKLIRTVGYAETGAGLAVHILYKLTHLHTFYALTSAFHFLPQGITFILCGFALKFVADKSGILKGETVIYDESENKAIKQEKRPEVSRKPKAPSPFAEDDFDDFDEFEKPQKQPPPPPKRQAPTRPSGFQLIKQVNNGITPQTSPPIQTPQEKPKEDTPQFSKNIDGNAVFVNRKYLLDTFIRALPLNTTGFSDVNLIDTNSELYLTLETAALKALASAKKVTLNDITARLTKAVESYFCYTLYISRTAVNISNLTAIETEIGAYFKLNSDDASVSGEVTIEGDFYKIIVYKGVNPLITLGDCLSLPKVYDFFANEKNALPMIAGVKADGEPLLTDAKNIYSMMTVGEPRTGKSWSLLAKLLQMCLFNTPQDVQFIIIDPKNTALLSSLSTLPHVCGFHGSDKAYDVLSDLINYEGTYREKLLLDNQCDTIYELRTQKGIKIPVIWVVIDEVVALNTYMKENYDAEKRAQFTNNMVSLITKFPSLGIRIYLTPHRTMKFVDTTVRSSVSYKEVVMSSNKLTKETLDTTIKKRLTHQGDTALLFRELNEATYVKGIGVCDDDIKNKVLIPELARAWYKIGFTQPNLDNAGTGNNRDEDKIKKTLGIA